MRVIKITKGYTVMVDDEDYEYLNQWKWSVNDSCKTLYAARMIRTNGKRKYTNMHRFILGINDSSILIDHRDGNGLNNQKSNLRIATISQNTANRKNSKNKYLGVNKRIQDGNIRWRATCKKNGIAYCKNFKTEEEAALAYNEMAEALHGEFAKLNVIDETTSTK